MMLDVNKLQSELDVFLSTKIAELQGATSETVIGALGTAMGNMIRLSNKPDLAVKFAASYVAAVSKRDIVPTDHDT